MYRSVEVPVGKPPAYRASADGPLRPRTAVASCRALTPASGCRSKRFQRTPIRAASSKAPGAAANQHEEQCRCCDTPDQPSSSSQVAATPFSSDPPFKAKSKSTRSINKLLRITAKHSESTSSALPPWFTRTHDPEDFPGPQRNDATSQDARNEWHLPWDDGSSDSTKEYERQFRRAVFSFDRWAAHRSTSR